MTVLLLPNSDKDKNLSVSRNAAAVMRGFGITVITSEEFSIDDTESLPTETAFVKADMAVSVGGDGTLLRAAIAAREYNTPILGINAGKTGFLTELEPGELHLLANLAVGKFTLDRRMLFDVTLNRDGKAEALGTALNDVVFARGSCAQAVNVDLSVDGNAFSSFSGDGLIIATPTGSTAYSLSAGGPIIEPWMSCAVITPICPHALYTHSFVLSADHRFTLSHFSGERYAYITVDGASPMLVLPGDSVDITRSEKTTDICRLKDRLFQNIVYEKLKRGD